MATRRAFLGGIGGAALAGSGLARASALTRVLAGFGGTPEEIARNESFWLAVQQAFTVDRSLVNLNNGGVSPAPIMAQEAQKRHLDFMNQMPPPYALWQVQEKRAEGVRERLARQFGVDREEIALTRNASEGLQILQFGFDLEAGDEVLCTTHDYPRMLNTFRQRERREGIRLVQVQLPVPAEDDDEVVRLYERAITERTRLILVSHVVFLTGQILPVRRIAALGRERGIPVIIDGAHALAHMDFTLAELACDYYASSLHKWLFAPVGCGLLYVRRERIAGVWPLMAATQDEDDNIRKFEQIGTHPEAQTLAIAESLSLHQAIGPANKEARLRFLRDRWANRLLASPRVRVHTSLDPRFSCGIAVFSVDGMDMGALNASLWNEHRIFATTVSFPVARAAPGAGGHAGTGGQGPPAHDVHAIRISPSVYTTLEEIDRFCEVIEAEIARS